MAEKESKREDRFESTVNRFMAFLDQNRNVVAVSVVAIILVGGAIYFRIQSHKKRVEATWNQFMLAANPAESPKRMQELFKKSEGTPAHFYVGLVLARRLYDENRKLEARPNPDDARVRANYLKDAVDTLEFLRKEYPDHPMAGDAQALYEVLRQELTWVREHGQALAPGARNRYRKKEWKKHEDKQARRVEQMDDKPGERPQVSLETEKGVIIVELFEDEAPNHVANFISLVQEASLDGRAFFQVSDGAVHAGCPSDDGKAESPYALDLEIGTMRHEAGVLAMAREGDGKSAGQRFYIAKKALPDRDGKHTIFGRVVVGLDVLAKIVQGDKIRYAWLDKKRMHEYEPWVWYPQGEETDGK